MRINETKASHIEIITESYDVTKEKLDFLEVITVFTEIHRMARNDWDLEDYCVKNDIYYNLLCRLEEIKNELEHEE